MAAVIYEENDELLIEIDCPHHGKQTHTFLHDKRFHVAIAPYVDRFNEKIIQDDWSGTFNHIDVSRDLYIDLTEECNYHCPACYTNANHRKMPPLSREEVFAGIDRLPRKIVVSLLGGEPTLREDLPEIIEYITRRGHLVKLITNGSRLTDSYIDTLYQAGLRWVILQFDGFDDAIYRRLRGRALLAEKLTVIEAMARRRINIVLASMIVPGVNDDQVGRILHFALCHPQIVQIGFLPVSDLGRNVFGEQGELEASTFIDLLAAQTNGKISRNDFVRAVREGQYYTRLTGNLAYKARTCCQGLFLFHDGFSADEKARCRSGTTNELFPDGKELMPIDRALSPRVWLRHPKKVLSSLKTIATWNEQPVNKNLLGIVIEKFRNRKALDFDDAKNCTKVYLTREGFIPNCIFNLIYRPKMHHEADNNA